MSKYRIMKVTGKSQFVYRVEKKGFIFWRKIIVFDQFGYPANNMFYSIEDAEKWIESGCHGIYKNVRKVVKVVKK